MSSTLNDSREGPLLFLRFGSFELDVRSGELRRQGSLVRIQPQPFKVLVLLVSRPGEVVTREEIQAEVWPAGTFVDFEQSLNFCIRQIRSALGDSALAPRYVETLPRRGYRWVGGVVERVGAPAERRDFPRAVGSVPLRAEGTETAIDPLAEPEEPPPPLEPPLVPSTLAPRASALRLTIAALAVVALVAGAVAAWLALRPSSAAAPPAFQRLTFRRGLVNSARFAPDGQVVYGAAWEGQPARVFVARSDPRNLSALEIDAGVVVGVSSAGEVAFLRGGALARAPLAGGPAKEVLKDVLAADWLADGSDFAVVRRVADGRFHLEFPVGRVIADAPLTSQLRLSPDGRYLAAVVHVQPDDDRGGALVWDRSGRVVAHSEGWSSVDGLAWAAGGREVWFTASRVGADNAVQALALDGRQRTVLAGMGRLVLHDVAPDGRVLLESATQRSEVLFRREGDSEDRQLSWFDYSAAEALSADGQTVFFFESGQGGGLDYTTFVRKTDGSAPVRVGSGRALSLSPDGQWTLAVSLHQPDHVDLLPIGPGEARSVRIGEGLAHVRAGFLGDGRRLYVTTRDAAGRYASWTVNADGSGAAKIALADARMVWDDPIAPDGARLIQSCPKSVAEGPCIFPFDGGAPLPVRGSRPGWYGVGWDEQERLYFRDRPKGVPSTLWRLDPKKGATVLASLAPRDRAGLLGLGRTVVSRRGDAWVYNVFRRLSDLHVVTGLR